MNITILPQSLDIFTISSYLLNIFLVYVVVKLLIDPVYNIFIRRALDVVEPKLRSLGYVFIMLDVDGMHQLNDKHGYDGVNKLIRSAVRHAFHVSNGRLPDIPFRYFSGDEFVVAIHKSSDPLAAAKRLSEIFLSQEHPVSATFCVGTDLKELEVALKAMKPADCVGERGTIKSIL